MCVRGFEMQEFIDYVYTPDIYLLWCRVCVVGFSPVASATLRPMPEVRSLKPLPLPMIENITPPPLFFLTNCALSIA